MSADWVKMRTDLYRDPKVSVIADELLSPDGDLAKFVDQNCQRHMTVTRNVMRNVTVGALVSVWGVMRQRGKRRDADLVCSGVAVSVLDDIADLPGFGAAMESAGWVIETPDGIEFPRFFEEFNVDPGTSPNAERQRRYRERHKAESNVTRNAESDVTRNVTVTPRVEKSREEKKEQKPPAAPDVVLPDWISSEAWTGFHAMRTKIRHPLTTYAAKLVVSELAKLRAAGGDANAILDQSTRNGWRDVFPLREGRPTAKPTTGPRRREL